MWACGTPASTNPELLGMLARQGLVQPTGTGELTAWAFDAESSVTYACSALNEQRNVKTGCLARPCHAEPVSESVEDLLMDSLNVTMGQVQPACLRVRCREVVSEVSLPGSCHPAPSVPDPL